MCINSPTEFEKTIPKVGTWLDMKKASEENRLQYNIVEPVVILSTFLLLQILDTLFKTIL